MLRGERPAGPRASQRLSRRPGGLPGGLCGLRGLRGARSGCGLGWARAGPPRGSVRARVPAAASPTARERRRAGWPGRRPRTTGRPCADGANSPDSSGRSPSATGIVHSPVCAGGLGSRFGLGLGGDGLGEVPLGRRGRRLRVLRGVRVRLLVRILLLVRVGPVHRAPVRAPCPWSGRPAPAGSASARPSCPSPPGRVPRPASAAGSSAGRSCGRARPAGRSRGRRGPPGAGGRRRSPRRRTHRPAGSAASRRTGRAARAAARGSPHCSRQCPPQCASGERGDRAPQVQDGGRQRRCLSPVLRWCRVRDAGRGDVLAEGGQRLGGQAAFAVPVDQGGDPALGLQRAAAASGRSRRPRSAPRAAPGPGRSRRRRWRGRDRCGRSP